MYTLLIEEHQKGTLNEEATFMLAKTLTADAKNNKKELVKLHEKALQFNKERWCNWINTDFQNLSIKAVKDLYCSHCNK